MGKVSSFRSMHVHCYSVSSYIRTVAPKRNLIYIKMISVSTCLAVYMLLGNRQRPTISGRSECPVNTSNVCTAQCTHSTLFSAVKEVVNDLWATREIEEEISLTPYTRPMVSGIFPAVT